MFTLTLATAVTLGGTPLPDDLCRFTSIRVELGSQNGLEIIGRSVKHEGGSVFEDVIAYTGEPIVVHVRTGVGRVSPPATGITVQVFRSEAVALTVRFVEWTQHGSVASYEGADFAAPEYRDVLPALPAGVYVFTAAPLGCDRSRWQDFQTRKPRLTVRSVSTPEDRAQLHMYRAKRFAFWGGDCDKALGELAAVDAYDPEAFVALSLRAHCVHRAGGLEDALHLYEKLEGKLESERRKTGLGLHLWGYAERIAEIRATLGSRRRSPTDTQKP